MFKSFVDVCCGFVWHSKGLGLISSHLELERQNFKMSQKVGDRPPHFLLLVWFMSLRV